MRLPCHDGQQEDMRRGDILRAQGRELRRQRLCLPGAGGRSGVCGRGQSCPSRRSAPHKGGGRFCSASGACRASPYTCLRRCPARAGAHRHQRQDDHQEPDIPGARREIQGRLHPGQPQQRHRSASLAAVDTPRHADRGDRDGREPPGRHRETRTGVQARLRPDHQCRQGASAGIRLLRGRAGREDRAVQISRLAQGFADFPQRGRCGPQGEGRSGALPLLRLREALPGCRDPSRERRRAVPEAGPRRKDGQDTPDRLIQCRQRACGHSCRGLLRSAEGCGDSRDRVVRAGEPALAAREDAEKHAHRGCI